MMFRVGKTVTMINCDTSYLLPLTRNLDPQVNILVVVQVNRVRVV
jgi:hypothetical protein